MRCRTKTPRETKHLARFIFRWLQKSAAKNQAAVIGLSGQLGAGKTTVAQGLGRRLGIREKIQSPTFVLIKKYRIGRAALFWENFFHVDAYRLTVKQKAITGGLKEIFKNPRNIVAVEWPEKIRSALPKHVLWVELRHNGANHRHIVLTPKIKNKKANAKKLRAEMP